MALCVVLEISPADLLVPRDLADDRTYQLTPTATARAGNVREWVRGEDMLLMDHEQDSEPDTVTVDGWTVFHDPATMIDPTPWMPADRASRVISRHRRGGPMSSQIYRRCGCRDEKTGKQLGQSCPKLKTDPKHGTWAYYLSAGSDPRTKQRRQYRRAGFKTKAAAVSAMAELKTGLDKGTYTEPSKLTLAEHAPKALERRRVTGTGLKPTTAATYERYVKQDIVPSKLGELKLTDIRRSHVNARSTPSPAPLVSPRSSRWPNSPVRTTKPVSLTSSSARSNWLARASIICPMVAVSPLSAACLPATRSSPARSQRLSTGLLMRSSARPRSNFLAVCASTPSAPPSSRRHGRPTAITSPANDPFPSPKPAAPASGRSAVNRPGRSTASAISRRQRCHHGSLPATWLP